MSNFAIKLEQVGKKYQLLDGHRTFVKKIFAPFDKPREVWALKDVNLEVRRGETIGVIGENGSGKSTLLKIIAGITTPTKGAVKVNGRIGSLIELGAGFHQDLTGRENIYLNGTLLGLTHRQLDKKYRQIVDFAEIGAYINQPLRTFSSGMVIRLGFSVAIHVEPDILLIDEVLAVGDEEFQRKSVAAINKFKQLDKTIIIVSHNMFLISNICPKTLWVSNGKIMTFEKTREAITSYMNSFGKNTINYFQNKKRWGNQEAKILDVAIYEGDAARETRTIKLGERFSIKVKVRFYKSAKNPVFGIIIRDSHLQDVFTTNTHRLGIETGSFKKGEGRLIEYKLLEPLPEGNYSVSPAIASSDVREFYDWRDNFMNFSVRGRRVAEIAAVRHEISIS